MKTTILIILAGFMLGMTHAQNSKSQVKVKNSSSNTSVSVSSTDNSYSYSASFDKDKTAKVKSAVESALGKAADETGRIALWDGKGYSASVRQGKAEIEFEKSNTTKSMQLKLEDLGEQISEVLESPKPPAPPAPPKTPKEPTPPTSPSH